jgi:ABC-type polysaccharide/polyol phosphate export permease
MPIFYSFAVIPQQYREVYQYNPVAALVLAMHSIFLEGKAPPSSLLFKLTLVSFASLALGLVVFRRVKHWFYEQL